MLHQDRHRFVGAPTIESAPFLRVPPFPGAKVAHFEAIVSPDVPGGDVLGAISRERIGGAYWGQQPSLPEQAILVRWTTGLDVTAELGSGRPVVSWSDRNPHRAASDLVFAGDLDPWHMLGRASALMCAADDPIGLVAAIIGVPIHIVSPDGRVSRDRRSPRQWLDSIFPPGAAYLCPFTGRCLSLLETVELCGFWRRLIDSNRDLSGGFGFAFWKKEAVAPLLWNGSAPFAFFTTIEEARGDAPSSVAVWRARTSPSILAELENSGASLVEVEDGFLRSRGLGADCVPPLSIVVDRIGPHFDPRGESELEQLLQGGDFSDAVLDRAAALREAIVKAGLGKYEVSAEPIDRLADGRTHILVPGQVEDDQSVLAGGGGLTSNLELLKRVRATAPDAYIIYKPHPDVVAGHRKGEVATDEALEHADRIVTDAPIAALVDMVDEVHVNTSLTGFEALLRNKAVTTHGVPFYAGWGLTIDLGQVPGRRTRRCSVDELVAATLLLYPRYLDPVTGLPCPAEVAVHRLTSAGEHSDLLVLLRRFQGRLMKRLRSMRR